MDRRDFIKNTCSAACACIGFSALSLLQSCEDNKAYEQNAVAMFSSCSGAEVINVSKYLSLTDSKNVGCCRAKNTMTANVTKAVHGDVNIFFIIYVFINFLALHLQCIRL